MITPSSHIEYTLIPTILLDRIVHVLEAVEPIVKSTIREERVSKKKAMELLGCGSSKLYEYKKMGMIKYKASSRAHRYNLKRIDKLIKDTST